LITVLQGDQNAARNLAARRIMPGDKQIGDHRDGFSVRQTLAVGFGGQQCGNEIVSRVLGAPGSQLVHIVLHLDDRGGGIGDLFGRHDHEHRAQRFGPLREHRIVTVRNAE
jgi:hypothetical protein